MDEVVKTLLIQILGFCMAMSFSFLLMNFWQRGYFWSYIKVRMSLDKLILVKLHHGATAVSYKVGKEEEGNLVWGKEGKDRITLNNLERRYLYREQNVNCVDIDGITFAYMPKKAYYAEVKNIPADAKPEDYAKIYDRNGQEAIITAVEGFDAGKIDAFVQAAQFRPSQMHKTIQLIMMICIVGLIISAAAAFAGFIAGDAVKKMDNHLSNVEGQVNKIVNFIERPVNVTTTGNIKATG